MITNINVIPYISQASQFQKVHDVTIHYQDEGTGPVLVLLHGAFSSLHTFDGWVEQLKDKYRIIRYDLPGFSFTGPNSDHIYTIDRHLTYLKGLLSALKITTFSIAGSSLGGWLGWEAALHWPKRVNSLILLNSAGFLDRESIPMPFKMVKTPFIKKIVRYALKKSVLEMFLREVYGDPSKVTNTLIDRYFHLFNQPGNIEAFFCLVNGRHIDRTHRLKDIHTPTLILWGERDKWLPISNAYRFVNTLPNATLINYEDLGHVPMEEAPELTAQDVISFLSKDKFMHVA